MMQILWSRNVDNKKLNLSSWESISVLKSMGGWGIKNFLLFSNFLCLKSICGNVFLGRVYGKIFYMLSISKYCQL